MAAQRLHKCGKKTQGSKDLFCWNFLSSIGKCQHSLGTWHAKCYTATDQVQFPVVNPENDEGVSLKKAPRKEKYMGARNCDSMFISFKCDYCWFQILMKRPMLMDSLGDKSMMAYIRRVQWDAMWSRSASTVSNLQGNLVTGRQMDGELSLSPIVIPRGPLPMYDDCVFQIGMQMLHYSQQPGRNVATHKQFDTVRRLRSSYTAAYASSPLFPWKEVKLQNVKGAMMHFYHAPSN